MRTECIILAIVVAGLFATPTSAQSSKLFTGAGSSTCGAWLSAAPGSANRDIFVTWVQGYQAGMEDGGAEQALPSESSATAFTQFVDNYCKANPLLHI